MFPPDTMNCRLEKFLHKVIIVRSSGKFLLSQNKGNAVIQRSGKASIRDNKSCKMNFDLDSKIAANKERLKHDLDNLRNIQISYGYIVVYISFYGLSFVDFLDYIKGIDWSCLSIIQFILLLLLLTTILLFCMTIYHFTRLFIPRTVFHDKLPEFVYKDMFSKITDWAQRHNKDPEIENKEAYLELLEKAVKGNFDLYVQKRGILYKSIQFALFSLLPYIIAIIIYHLIK